jgi:putative tricarboxylic transport membrane protein
VSADIESPRATRAALPVMTNLRFGGIAATALLALLAVFFVVGAAFLPLGSTKLPGPGLFPLVLGVALLILCCAVAFDVWREGHSPETIEFGHPNVAITAALLLFVPLAFEPVGAYLTLGAFTFIMLVAIARAGVLTAIASSAAGMAGAWLVFQKTLGVQLPLGLLAG